MTPPQQVGPDETVNLGLGTPFLQHRQYQPAPNVVEMFMVFRPIQEEAWMKAGLARRDAARKRRIHMDYNYILFGVTDVMGDQTISLASEAGRDGEAMKRAERVAIGSHQLRLEDRYGGDRQPPRRDGNERRS